MDWKNIKYKGIHIRRFVSVYDFVDRAYIPWPFKIKITEDENGKFWGSVSLVIKDANGQPQWIKESGDTEKACLEKTLNTYLETVEKNPKGYDLDESDVVWSTYKDF